MFLPLNVLPFHKLFQPSFYFILTGITTPSPYLTSSQNLSSSKSLLRGNDKVDETFNNKDTDFDNDNDSDICEKVVCCNTKLLQSLKDPQLTETLSILADPDFTATLVALKDWYSNTRIVPPPPPQTS